MCAYINICICSYIIFVVELPGEVIRHSILQLHLVGISLICCIMVIRKNEKMLRAQNETSHCSPMSKLFILWPIYL